ncbi:uncharacterized protein LOC109419735, partial [Aedes albopictus]|uniref:Uncharacterized protein n=1 Tax=Aedes albopictus TaxID=7160 RepID=A0ABM1Y3Z1_AEDAL
MARAGDERFVAENSEISNVVLKELNLPAELLAVFEELSYNVDRFSTVTKDELIKDLGAAGWSCDWDLLYDRITAWRKLNGFDLITFTKVEVLEEWVCSEEVEASEQTLFDPELRESSERLTFSPVVSATGTIGSVVASVDLPGPSSSSSVPSADLPETSSSSAVESADLHESSSSVVTLADLSVSSSLSAIPSADPRVDLSGSSSSSAVASVNLPEPSASRAVTSTEHPGPSFSAQSVVPPKGKGPDETRDLDTPCSSSFFGPRDLEVLLRKSLSGEALLARAPKGPLTERSQKDLAEIIAEHHLNARLKTTERVLDSYAESITLLFRQEKKDCYYIPRSGEKRNPGGKIYNKIANLKQKRIKRDKYEEDIEAKRQKHNTGSTGVDIELDAAAEAAFNWLRLNTQPWQTTVNQWKASFNRRRRDLQKPALLANVDGIYRHYKDPYGFQLIDEDFDRLYNITTDDPIDKWNRSLAGLTVRLCQQYKDGASNKLVDLLRNGAST